MTVEQALLLLLWSTAFLMSRRRSSRGASALATQRLRTLAADDNTEHGDAEDDSDDETSIHYSSDSAEDDLSDCEEESGSDDDESEASDAPSSRRPARRERIKNRAPSSSSRAEAKARVRALGPKPDASAPPSTRLLHAFRSAIARAQPPLFPSSLHKAAAHLIRTGRRRSNYQIVHARSARTANRNWKAIAKAAGIAPTDPERVKEWSHQLLAAPAPSSSSTGDRRGASRAPLSSAAAAREAAALQHVITALNGKKHKRGYDPSKLVTKTFAKLDVSIAFLLLWEGGFLVFEKNKLGTFDASAKFARWLCAGEKVASQALLRGTTTHRLRIIELLAATAAPPAPGGAAATAAIAATATATGKPRLPIAAVVAAAPLGDRFVAAEATTTDLHAGQASAAATLVVAGILDLRVALEREETQNLGIVQSGARAGRHTDKRRVPGVSVRLQPRRLKKRARLSPDAASSTASTANVVVASMGYSRAAAEALVRSVEERERLSALRSSSAAAGGSNVGSAGMEQQLSQDVLAYLMQAPGISLRNLEAKMSPLPHMWLCALVGRLVRSGRVRVHLARSDVLHCAEPCTAFSARSVSAASAAGQLRVPVNLNDHAGLIFLEPSALALCEDGVCAQHVKELE